MSLVSLLPVGGAGLGLLAARAISGLSQGLAAGLSFDTVLAGQQVSEQSAETDVSELPPAADLETLIPKFAAALRDRMRTAGVSTTASFTLKDDGTGRVLVDGDHADRASIEELFASDSELLAQFHEIAAAAEERHSESSVSPGNRFGEFRLNLAGQSAAIYFE